MSPAKTPGENRKRHCWECLRRRLVCDSAKPACRRCAAAGTACPGYSDQEPARLTWLPPGRVTSRNRTPKGSLSTRTERNYNESTLRTTAELGRRANDVTVPRFKMTTEVGALFEATEYYNTCIYQDLAPIHELGPNQALYRIPPAYIQYAATFPEHLRSGFMCMTLSHRINRTRNDHPPCNALVETYYRYRGKIIHSLSDDIAVEHKRTGNIVIAGVITLLLADAQQGASLDWRCHLEGVRRLITLRGGIRAMATSKTLESVLLCFVLVAAMGNTTSPASDLAMTGSLLDDLDFVLEHYGGGLSPFQTCPPALFAEVVKINHLRMRAAEHGPDGVEKHFSLEGYEILNRIHSFSPERWADTKPLLKDAWVLIGNVFQAAMVLYCISSLQSLSVLPLTISLRARCVTHGRVLQVLLSDALSSPRVKRYLLWPLVVLGVEAVHADAAMRSFVLKQLSEISLHVGMYVPLAGKKLLERFWASGETRWDVCFDRPYAFLTQFAVDQSGIISRA